MQSRLVKQSMKLLTRTKKKQRRGYNLGYDKGESFQKHPKLKDTLHNITLANTKNTPKEKKRKREMEVEIITIKSEQVFEKKK